MAGKSYRSRETEAAEQSDILPLAVSEPMNEPAEAEPEPVTIEDLRETLERRQSELDAVRNEQSAVRQQLAAAFADPAALDAASIMALRSRFEGLSVRVPIAQMQERSAQRGLYAALMQEAEWLLGPALAERDGAEEAYRQAKERVDRAQSAATGHAVDAQEYRKLATRVQQEMDAIRQSFLKSEAQAALRTPLVRDDLMGSVRAEIALFRAGGKQ